MSNLCFTFAANLQYAAKQRCYTGQFLLLLVSRVSVDAMQVVRKLASCYTLKYIVQNMSAVTVPQRIKILLFAPLTERKQCETCKFS